MAKSVESTFAYYSGTFPDAVSVNSTGPSTSDGTEVIKSMIDNWLFGPQQALLDYAGLTPDEVVESATASQTLEALRLIFGPAGTVVEWHLDDDPATVGARFIILQGQGVLVASYPDLTTNTYVGDSANPTAPAYYRATDAAGTSRSTTGAYLILPDRRGVVPSGIGTQDINGRTKTGPSLLGSLGEDQTQAWQLGTEEDLTGARDYWAYAGNRDRVGDSSSSSGFTNFLARTTGQGDSRMFKAMNDGTNGDPRQGLETKASES
jgi:hypothetical protein